MLSILNSEIEASPSPESPLPSKIYRSFDQAAGPLALLHRLDHRFQSQWFEALEHLRQMKKKKQPLKK